MSDYLGKLDILFGNVCNTKHWHSHSLESVCRSLVAHLALCPCLFLSGRHLQPFPPLVNRWVPAPRFPTILRVSRASLTCSPRAERPQTPTKVEETKAQSQESNYYRAIARSFGVADVSKQNIRFPQIWGEI